MSHRNQTHAPERRTARRNATVPQTSKSTYSGVEKWNRSSVVSSISGERVSTDSNDEFSPKPLTQRRASGIPRPKNTQSGPRLDAIAASRPIPTLPPPSKFKISATYQPHAGDPHQDIFLFYPLENSPLETMASEPHVPINYSQTRAVRTSSDYDPHAILGQSLPDRQKPPRPVVTPPTRNVQRRPEEFPPRLIPELQALAAASAHATSAPPASISSISSPSTMLTDSPGVWSSRNTTPTSVSSYSPAIVTPLKKTSTGKRANTVPVSATSKTTFPRLPVLQESLHSSNSSVMGKDVAPSNTKSGSKKKKSPLATPAPTPPPRISSVKHKASKSGSDIPSVPHDLDHTASQPVPDAGYYPLTKEALRQIQEVRKPFPISSSEAVQDIKQQQAPPRPSRSGVWSLDPRRPLAVQSSLPISRRDKHRATRAAVTQTPIKGESRSLGLDPQVANTKHAASRDLERLQLPTSTQDHPTAPPQGAPKSLSRKGPNPYLKSVSKAEEASSSSRLGKFSRFAIFGRRNKQSDEVQASPRKLQRKGPTAGTGHEGYGKFARRVRKNSLESDQSESSSDRSEGSLTRLQNRFRSRKHSTGSRRDRSSQSDLDDFAANRLQPVAILGGSARLDNARETIWPASQREPDIGSSNQIVVPWAREQQTQESTGVSTVYPGSHNPGSNSAGYSRPEELSFDFDRYRTPIAATAHDKSAPSYPTSANTSQSSISGAVVSTSGIDTGMYRVASKLLRNQDKEGKRSKWNFFSRNTQPHKPVKTVPAPAPSTPKMPVKISAGPMSRSIPYYAVMESESENNTTEHIDQVLSEAVESVPPLPREDAAALPANAIPQRGNSMLLPSLPLFESDSQAVRRPSSPRVPLQREQESQPPAEKSTPPEPRPRRLAAVGRIPRVISRKGRQNTPGLPPAPLTDNNYATKLTTVAQSGSTSSRKPVLGIRTDAMPNKQLNFSEDTQHPYPYSTAVQPGQGQAESRKNEFLRFPSKHSSDFSASSSSTGAFSVVAPSGVLPVPLNAHSSRHHVGEDEIWNEYDDFLDHVMSPAESIPVQPALRDGAQSAANYSPSRPSKQIRTHGLPKIATLPEIQSSLAARAPPVVFPPPSLLSESSSSGEIRLRRSRIVSALDPSSPFSIGDFFSEYGNWDKYGNKLSERYSSSTAHKSGYLSPAGAEKPSEVPDHTEHSQQHNAILLDVVGRSKNPAAQSELHFSSLMISRWLSFGRVLFSPAHDEIHNIPERHVLVLDGLGSVDWSVYCAVIYQGQKAYVHDLKEKDAGQSPIDPGHAPPNYRRAEISSLADRFPFPERFFSAIVLRFPPSMSDYKLRNIITECKRVLSPGGYLELMLLDLDIVNMGTQTRRAVRDLKIRITTADRTISLKPLSDNLQAHLGQQGFLNLSRCVVGVPVAGKMSESIRSSSSSRSSRGSSGQQRRPSADGQQSIGQSGRPTSHYHHGHNFSLNDLVSDHSENADEKIGRMVSRTARSWWQHCFEAAVISDGNLSRSIFAEKQLIRECKLQGSNFKLLIAYTQKPFENKRRTMSEPIIPTLATAGTTRWKRTAS